ncbi:MAG: Gfo/Idh/MocA family oxidoreductase [Elusimicrobia bacterium]|nr:Gfo/Idh/MocA family oxidoreductase [Elusimicrobiota bacterium]
MNPKIAVIGAGNWGKNLVRNFMKLDALYAVCDSTGDVLENVKSSCPGVRTTGEYPDILKDSKVDGVVIATQAHQHYELAREALLAGKSVFIEKPMTTKVKDAEALAALAEKHPAQTVMVGHLMNYHPVVAKMKQIINAGELGEIYYLYSTRINLGVVRQVENVVWSLAVHDISVFIDLIPGGIRYIDCQGGAFIQESIEDVAFINLYFENGIMGHIHAGWLDPLKIRRMTVVGSGKMAVFDDMLTEESLKIYDKGVMKNNPESAAQYSDNIKIRYGDIHTPRIDMKEPLGIECGHFIDCMKNRKKPLSDVYKGLEVVRILAAADKALEKSAKIKI